MPGDVHDWLTTFAQSFTAPLAQAERRAYLDEVRAGVKDAYCDAHGVWPVDYVRLRFSARKSER